jgi:hypothetical protein
VDRSLQDAGWPRTWGEHSDPTRWVAHCTLATRVPKPFLRRAKAAVRERFAPVEARIDALATILVGGHGDVGYTPLG